MSHKIDIQKRGDEILMIVRSKSLEEGLMLQPAFPIRSLHFGTRVGDQDISKCEGYGWDGIDHITAEKLSDTEWQLNISIRVNDPNNPDRRFIKGNCYIRTKHNEIYYFDLRKWEVNPSTALVTHSDNNLSLQIDVDAIS